VRAGWYENHVHVESSDLSISVVNDKFGLPRLFTKNSTETYDYNIQIPPT